MNITIFLSLKVASVEVPLYVTFHFINAYEETDEDGRVVAVIADCCEHNADTTILETLRLQNLRSFTGQDVLPDARCVFPYTPLESSHTQTRTDAHILIFLQFVEITIIT